MKSIARAIRAALAAMKQMIWKVVEVGGKAILMLVPAAPVIEPAPAVEDLVEIEHNNAETVDRYDAIKKLAASIDSAEPALVKAAGGPEIARWLSAMSPAMRATIVMAKPAEISDHMRGRQSLRGVLAYDVQSIADYSGPRAPKPKASGSEPDAELNWAMSM